MLRPKTEPIPQQRLAFKNGAMFITVEREETVSWHHFHRERKIDLWAYGEPHVRAAVAIVIFAFIDYPSRTRWEERSFLCCVQPGCPNVSSQNF